MLQGAQLASKMGDSARSSKYSYVANQIESTINMTFWTGSYIMSSTNAKLDGLVAVALNYGYNNDQYISPTNQWVSSTINALNTYYCDAFPINNKMTAEQTPGIFYGLAGAPNPWYGSSAALAQLFYSGATIVGLNGLTDNEFNVWKEFFKINELNNIQDIQDALTSAGDAVMNRIYTLASHHDFHLYEQIDKDTGSLKQNRIIFLGEESRNPDDTFNYAMVLTALKIRDGITNYTLIKAKKAQ